jgi:hypothetical protein
MKPLPDKLQLDIMWTVATHILGVLPDTGICQKVEK